MSHANTEVFLVYASPSMLSENLEHTAQLFVWFPNLDTPRLMVGFGLDNTAVACQRLRVTRGKY